MNYWNIFAEHVGRWMVSFLPFVVAIAVIALFIELWQRENGKIKTRRSHMKRLTLPAVLLALLLLVSSSAYAEMIQGEVLSIDSAAGSLVITRIIPLTGDANLNPKSEPIQILVLPSTQFEGIESLEELRSGDEIWADVTENKDAKNWSAKTIKIDKVNIQNKEEAL